MLWASPHISIPAAMLCRELWSQPAYWSFRLRDISPTGQFAPGPITMLRYCSTSELAPSCSLRSFWVLFPRKSPNCRSRLQSSESSKCHVIWSRHLIPRECSRGAWTHGNARWVESEFYVICKFEYSVVTVAGICNLVSGGFFDMPPWCWWRWRISEYRSVSRLALLIGNRWKLQLHDRSGYLGMH